MVDLFCGCGGLTYGLQSTGRFQTVLSVDSSEDALRTLVHNHSVNGRCPKIIAADLGSFGAAAIRSELRRLGILTGELDCLVGGPPCEGFSQNHGKAIAGRDAHDFLASDTYATRQWYRARGASATRVKRTRRSQLHDARNHLFRIMLDAAELTKPKIVVIENVREFLTYKDGEIKDEICIFLEAIGYRVEVAVLNAADYGVPQLRKRAFIVALRSDIAATFSGSAFPKRTHKERQNGSADRDGVYVTVREALMGLPVATLHDGNVKPDVPRRITAPTPFQRYIAGGSGTVYPSQHVTRPISLKVLNRIKAMKPGMKIRDLPAKLRPRKFYANAYARLQWGKPANTITKSFNNLGSGKFCHPSRDRGITVREAARLQSFPDTFEFVGSVRAITAMIGGAVPPLLARALGLHFADILDCATKPRKRSARQDNNRAHNGRRGG
ncbi:MAG TPA: DNA cytosine methyltransferase [Candidatus Rubrimentiphilum sp.]|nr:DNA cytosine methyltransferase [Candidatus Rubrimentiphilum sp.]